MANNNAIQTMVDQSAQSRFRDDPDLMTSGGVSLLTGLIRAGELLPAWWSRQRDIEMFRFFMQSDHLQAAEYRIRTKVIAVKPKVVPRDSNVKRQIQLADEFNTILYENWEMGEGWQVGFERDLTNYLTQDNGFFREVLGDGPKDGEIIGSPTGTMSLDPSRCRRTGNLEFPVIYWDTDGNGYKLHRSRVMFASQSSVNTREAKGVGRCWVTRCVNYAQNLIDILLYKQEKLGSRPLRQMLIGKGVTAQQIWEAVVSAEESMDNANLRRFAKTVVIGSQSTDIDVEQRDLANIPDGFDERVSTELAMFTIALAAGVPPRDLWPATTVGATKADAETQHVSGSSGYQAILDTFAFLIGGSPIGSKQNLRGKFLPPTLKLVFDFVDDEQDARHAKNASIRAETRERDINDGVITIRVAREQALADSDITSSQFEELELSDGRLPDGSSVLNLFLSTDRQMQQLLDISTPNPLDVDSNAENAGFVIERVKEAILLANLQAVNASTSRLRQQAKQAVRALTEIEKIYSNLGKEEESEVTEENPVNTAIEEDQEEKALTDQEIISFAPFPAQQANYRRANELDILNGHRCASCRFNEVAKNCSLFQFQFTRGFTCDKFENRITSNIFRRAYNQIRR